MSKDTPEVATPDNAIREFVLTGEVGQPRVCIVVDEQDHELADALFAWGSGRAAPAWVCGRVSGAINFLWRACDQARRYASDHGCDASHAEADAFAAEARALETAAATLGYEKP